jgi:hypothetical protein|tara:strand:+ start:8688 stop:9266 length:579 start_codon:yes stop_codon:yes gene_type:complete
MGAEGPEISGLGKASIALQVAGTVSSAIGAFYSVKSAQYQAKSKALSLEFEQSMSYIDARNAERDAQATLLSGQYEVGKVGLQYGQVKEATLARQAASGIQGGVGSAGEIATSIEFAKEADQLTITRNAVRAASAHRTRRVNVLARGRLAGVSAQNLRGTAGAMSPGLAGFSSLLGGAGGVARNWYDIERAS